MGQFSWIYSDTKEKVVNGREKKTFLLVPEKFQEKYGQSIVENCYDGYGDFGEYDIFDLVAEWNKETIPEILRRAENGNWHSSISEKDKEEFRSFFEGKPITCEKRWLGILMCAYDEDNFALEYPVKITSKDMKYKEAMPSESDPDQGWA